MERGSRGPLPWYLQWGRWPGGGGRWRVRRWRGVLPAGQEAPWDQRLREEAADRQGRACHVLQPDASGMLLAAAHLALSHHASAETAAFLWPPASVLTTDSF